jgi:hypothetical protein
MQPSNAVLLVVLACWCHQLAVKNNFLPSHSWQCFAAKAKALRL